MIKYSLKIYLITVYPIVSVKNVFAMGIIVIEKSYYRQVKHVRGKFSKSASVSYF